MCGARKSYFIVQGQDAVHHGILSEHSDVLFLVNRCDVVLKSHSNQGILRLGAEQLRRQEP